MSTQAQQGTPVQERGSIDPRKALDQLLAQRASQVPQDWREYIKTPAGKTVILNDIYRWVNTLEDKHYFFVEQLAVAFGNTAKADVIRKLANGDEATVAEALQQVISDAVNGR